MAKDIVCGMFVDEKTASIKKVQEGRTYYFCSETCLREFEAPAIELRNLKAITTMGVALSVPILLISFLLQPPLLDRSLWLFLLTTPVQFVGGWRFYRGTRDAIRNRMANMDSLIAVGTSAAYFYSAAVTLFPHLSLGGEVYYDVAAVIIALILFGRLMEHLVRHRAREAHQRLEDLQPSMASVIRGGSETEVPVEQVKVGDIVLVKPGDRVPIDGFVVEGYSSVDQSAITGESIPVEKKVGDEVFSATINKTGVLKIKATKVGADTTLAQIIQLVEEAQLSKVPIQRLADLVSSYFVPVVIAIAIGSSLAWYYLGGVGFTFSFLTAIAVLIIACPCALGIATPAAIMVGAGKAAEGGVLLKGGEYLEKAHRVQTIVFDKTGTLTRGQPSVTDIVNLGGFDANEVMALAAAAEKGSEHPLAEAILKKAQEMRIDPSEPKAFEAVPGHGVRVRHRDREVLLGNRQLMRQASVSTRDVEEKVGGLEEEGKTVMLLSIDGRIGGIIAVADTLKEGAVEAVRRLQEMGIEAIILTGDSGIVAKALARRLGIQRVIAEVLPGQKAEVIKGLQREGKVVAMVGDGINDAPALAQADVGIAIGSGSDVAKETGGIILIKDELRDVVRALEISKKTMKKIKENLFWAFFYNVVLIPLAAGALYPFFKILLNPMLAAAAMAFSSVTVVANSLLLKRSASRP